MLFIFSNFYSSSMFIFIAFTITVFFVGPYEPQHNLINYNRNFTFFVLPYAITFYVNLNIMMIILLSQDEYLIIIIFVSIFITNVFLTSNFIIFNLNFKNLITSYPKNQQNLTFIHYVPYQSNLFNLDVQTTSNKFFLIINLFLIPMMIHDSFQLQYNLHSFNFEPSKSMSARVMSLFPQLFYHFLCQTFYIFFYLK